jgi:hypothetical protein
VLVDAAQTGDAGPPAKLVQHPGVGQPVAIRQVREAAPGAEFGQQCHQQIERMHGSQQCQQMGAPQLGGTEHAPPAAAVVGRPQRVDELVRNIR